MVTQPLTAVHRGRHFGDLTPDAWAHYGLLTVTIEVALTATGSWTPNIQTTQASQDEAHPVWQPTGKFSHPCIIQDLFDFPLEYMVSATTEDP